MVRWWRTLIIHLHPVQLHHRIFANFDPEAKSGPGSVLATTLCDGIMSLSTRSCCSLGQRNSSARISWRMSYELQNLVYQTTVRDMRWTARKWSTAVAMRRSKPIWTAYLEIPIRGLLGHFYKTLKVPTVVMIVGGRELAWLLAKEWLKSVFNRQSPRKDKMDEQFDQYELSTREKH
jgi:hypothetical protein